MLDAIWNNAKGDDNFATKVIITEDVERKSSSLKKKQGERAKFLSFPSYYLGRLV